LPAIIGKSPKNESTFELLPMKVPTPHFLLFSESSRKQRQGQWRFLLKAVDGTEQLEAADAEPEVQGERLELLAVVRGLEALDQPSRVTLVTPSKYVHRGLIYGLEEWRTNGWSWEHFGQMVPVKNRDLWQRLDHAMTVHDLDFQPWRWDAAAVAGSNPTTADALTGSQMAEVMSAAAPAQPPAGRIPAATPETTPDALPRPTELHRSRFDGSRVNQSRVNSGRRGLGLWTSLLSALRLGLALAAGRLMPRLRVG
jgi:ribonuclease HI